MKKILNADTIFGLIVLIVCAVFFTMGSQLVGMKNQAGPGLFAQLISVVTGILAVMLMVNGVRTAIAGTGKEIPGSASDRRLFYITLIFTGLYVLAWPHVHFIICTAAFILGMCWLLKMSWKFAIIYSAIFSVGIYYVFANVFRILL